MTFECQKRKAKLIFSRRLQAVRNRNCWEKSQNSSDVNKDWTCKDKDKDKDQAYKDQDKDKDKD